MTNCNITWAVFDYGGVLAEEGFVAGLEAIAEKEGLRPEYVFETARDIILATGYLTGEVLEETFWNRFRRETGIKRSDQDLRNEILSRFILRPWMIELIASLKKNGVNTAILSDQVNWLDELDIRDNFFSHFNRVYNSFHVGLSKNNPAVFEDLTQWIDASPNRILFTDDHLPHIKRARSRGINAIHYTDKDSFLREFYQFCPVLSAK
ncbi:MAG: HAD family hydrolase [Desulfonatronovibrio sp.]